VNAADNTIEEQAKAQAQAISQKFHTVK